MSHSDASVSSFKSRSAKASNSPMPVKIAVTGATGFVGAAITDLLLSKGFQVSVFVRNPEKLQRVHINPNDVDIVTGDFTDANALKEFASRADHLIHFAGLTHALRNSEFNEVNVEGARKLAAFFNDAPRGNGRRFIHISSLAARRPDISHYARSKFESEGAIAKEINGECSWVTLRAPAMFGPRDLATLPFFKAVKRGLAPIPGRGVECRASILYVEDFANAVLEALLNSHARQVYEIGDAQPEGYSWEEIAKNCAAAQGVSVRTIALPRFVLMTYAGIASFIMRQFGIAPMVTREKIAEFFHPDWAARENLLKDATDWRPIVSLEDGFARTALWYNEHGML